MTPPRVSIGVSMVSPPWRNWAMPPVPAKLLTSTWTSRPAARLTLSSCSASGSSMAPSSHGSSASSPCTTSTACGCTTSPAPWSMVGAPQNTRRSRASTLSSSRQRQSCATTCPGSVRLYLLTSQALPVAMALARTQALSQSRSTACDSRTNVCPALLPGLPPNSVTRAELDSVVIRVARDTPGSTASRRWMNPAWSSVANSAGVWASMSRSIRAQRDGCALAFVRQTAMCDTPAWSVIMWIPSASSSCTSSGCGKPRTVAIMARISPRDTSRNSVPSGTPKWPRISAQVLRSLA